MPLFFHAAVSILTRVPHGKPLVLRARTMAVHSRAAPARAPLPSRPLLREPLCTSCEFKAPNPAPSLSGVGQTARHENNINDLRHTAQTLKNLKRTKLMKALIATTALALTIAGAASASVDASVIQQYAPNADVSTLSDATVNTILSAIHSDESAAETRALVQALVK